MESMWQMQRNKLSQRNFGFMIAAGALVFLLNLIFGLNIYVDSPDTEQQNTEVVGESEIDSQLGESTEIEDAHIMKVHFLDVGQGLSILVQLGDDVLIYDGGERDTSSFVVAYLKEQGVTEIDYLISSHYDSDHVSGLIGCLYAFDVKNVIGSNYVHDSKLYTSFMNAIEEKGLEIEYPPVGTQYQMGDAVVTILSPSEIVGDSNSNSLAIKLSYGESDFIFTGDADYKSERDMIASGIDLDSEVLSVAHHGSASGTSEKFLQATTPEYAVISCGKDNGYGHPHKEVLQVLTDFEVKVLRNDELGTIVVETDGEKLEWDVVLK